MDYNNLKWGELKTFAKSQGINTRGLKKAEILSLLIEIDCIRTNESPTVAFKGIKESTTKAQLKHPLFTEIKKYLPSLKAYVKLNAVDARAEYNIAIAELFLKHIETDKNAVLNINCGQCISKYYIRMIAGYNRLAEKYGEPSI